MWKKAYSQAGWALVTNGVTESRLEVHRLRHMVDRIVGLSHQSEFLNQIMGDVIQDAPRRLDRLEESLDRTSYALSCLGEEELKSLISQESMTMVDESLQDSKHPQPKLYHVKLARWFTRRVKARQVVRDQ